MLGTISIEKESAISFFVISTAVASFSLLFALMFVEIMRRGFEVTVPTIIGGLLTGGLVLETIFSSRLINYYVYKLYGFWERTTFRSDIGKILLLVLMLLFVIDFFYVTRRYMKKTKSPEKRKYAYLLFLSALIMVSPVIISPLTFVYEEANYLIVPYQFIAFTAGILVLSIILIKNPFFAYMLPQEFLAFLLIRKKDGILIYSKAFTEGLKDKASLFASFLEATFSAVRELIGVGAMTEIKFENNVLTFGIGGLTYAAIVTDKESTIVYQILKKIIDEIESEIPKEYLVSPVIDENTIKKIEDIMNRNLYTLLP